MSCVSTHCAVGSLLFPATVRLDIIYATEQIGRYLLHFDHSHWSDVKRIMHYIHGDYRLFPDISSENNNTQVVGYTDANVASCNDTRTQIARYFIHTFHKFSLCP